MNTEELRKSLLGRFVETTGDRLQTIQLGVLELEKGDAQRSSENVARELHTMKGEARMMGLHAIGQLAHGAEDVLKATREGRLEPRAAIDLMLRACDAVSDLLDDLEAAKHSSPAAAAIAARMAEVSGQPVPPLLPGGRHASVQQLSEVAAAPPAPEPRAPLGGSASAPRPPASAPPTSAPRPSSEESVERRAERDRSIRVNVETLDHLGLLSGDLLVESARARLRSEELEGIFERFSRVGDRFLELSEGFPHDGPLREHLDRVENDLHLLRDDAFRFVRKHIDGLDALHGSLVQTADHVADARLVPLASIFDAFPRAVRDLARQENKQVELKVSNPGVGVDRSMVADVRDALVHLIRNAVDHGVESPDFREALGKPPSGHLDIRVRADGDMLAIEVEDDGRGIDPERLRQTAVARKLLTASQATSLSEREAFELIFRAGFSTRDEVSELSGRGVGMDVVKRKVEALGGSVSVASRLGRGTTISLRLPQSLALMRVLLVRLGDDVYGIPAADVEAVARFKPEDRMEIFGTLAVMHRGKPVSFAALGPLLALNGGPRHDRPPAVVVRHGDDRAALVVDGFVDEREVAVKPCGGEFLKGAAFVAGSAALEDGRIAVLLHVPDIMAEVRKLSRPVSEQQSYRRLRILLVDDSPIARATESALVKALGHLVEESPDGEDAWARIQAQPFDLILTDVQMPRLDGFGLTRRIKGNPELARLPVIILSSLASPEDKRRGLDAGADAYLIKGELGVESLALAIDRLT